MVKERPIYKAFTEYDGYSAISGSFQPKPAFSFVSTTAFGEHWNSLKIQGNLLENNELILISSSQKKCQEFSAGFLSFLVFSEISPD